jgi:hypothetical protein
MLTSRTPQSNYAVDGEENEITECPRKDTNTIDFQQMEKQQDDSPKRAKLRMPPVQCHMPSPI